MIKQILILVFIVSFKNIIAQTVPNAINIQGQLASNYQNSTITIKIEIFDINNVVLYSENHSNVIVNDNNAYNLELGHGNYISGIVTDLTSINWINVNTIKIINVTNSNLLIGVFKYRPLPYTYHSKNTSVSPTLIDLSDTPQNINNSSILIKYDGFSFVESNRIFNDSIYFSWYNNQSNYSDTALNAFNNFWSDSSLFSFYSDSATISINSNHSIYADSSSYSDTSLISNIALNNWGLNGNALLNNNNYYLGTTSNNSLELKTNNQSRLTFSTANGFSNYNQPSGLKLNNNGALFNFNANNNLNNLSIDHIYFSGNRNAFHGGNSNPNSDTLLGDYSFSYGYNVGTNGTFSTVFGYNNYGDSSLIGTLTYSSVSSFIVGTNNSAGRISVAIGENCHALYYRNVALGKDVYAGVNNSSASLGIGNNIISSGAVAWACGKNLQATGHFSTALGVNASTNIKLGSFIFGDLSTTDTVVNTANNQFMIRADSGYVFYTSTDLSMGVNLNHGSGSWNMISDRNKKENINLINNTDFSKKLLNTPVYLWQYNNQNTFHIGAMAQNFNTNFKVGELPNYINSGDIDGVIFTGIKQLNQNINSQNKTKNIITLNSEIKSEKNKMEELKIKIEKLYEELDY